MAPPRYTVSAQVDQETEDWLNSQPRSRNWLVQEALRNLRNWNIPQESIGGSSTDPDPYSTAVVSIVKALQQADLQTGSMSEGEVGILWTVFRALVGEDSSAFGDWTPTNLRDQVVTYHS